MTKHPITNKGYLISLKIKMVDIFEEIRMKTDKNEAEKNPLAWLTNMCQCFYDNADIMIILLKTKANSSKNAVGFCYIQS